MKDNTPDQHKQLLDLTASIGSPTELEAVLQALSAMCAKTANRIAGKYPASIAYWGTGTRLLKQAQSELKEIRS